MRGSIDQKWGQVKTDCEAVTLIHVRTDVQCRI
jgi:hypothetical protein